jgi:AcrR family transcriptional regulator
MMTKNKSPKRGRPPKEFAGDVQERILDAAQQLFLEKGFRSASIDDISEMAPASKPTIYAHFPGKEALFAAVVARTINGLTDFEGFTSRSHHPGEALQSWRRDSGEIYRGYVGPHARHDRRGAAISRVEPKCSRRGARPRGWGSFAALE